MIIHIHAAKKSPNATNQNRKTGQVGSRSNASQSSIF